MKRQKVFARFICSQCQRINYYLHQSKKDVIANKKLELKKFCKWCRAHVLHQQKKR